MLAVVHYISKKLPNIMLALVVVVVDVAVQRDIA